MPVIRIDKRRNKEKIKNGEIKQKIEAKNKNPLKAKTRYDRLHANKPVKIWWRPNRPGEKELLHVTDKVSDVFEILFLPSKINGKCIVKWDETTYTYKPLSFDEHQNLAARDGFNDVDEFLKYYELRYGNKLYSMPFFVIRW